MLRLAPILAVVALACGCLSSSHGSGGGEARGTAKASADRVAAVKTSAARASLSEVERCTAQSEWCTPTPAQVPAPLRRALHLPHLKAGNPCPTARGLQYENELFGGIALGKGRVQPLIAVRGKRDVAPALRGALRFYPYYGGGGWYSLKTLWFARPGYGGPVFIRGRQLDGAHVTVFGEAPTIVDPLLRAGATTNGRNGFREWPGATFLRAPGCYAWQVDGLGFSDVIVFEALFRKR
jgi:hypothetical protein